MEVTRNQDILYTFIPIPFVITRGGPGAHILDTWFPPKKNGWWHTSIWEFLLTFVVTETPTRDPLRSTLALPQMSRLVGRVSQKQDPQGKSFPTMELQLAWAHISRGQPVFIHILALDWDTSIKFATTRKHTYSTGTTRYGTLKV